ncbi:Cyanate hydratase [Vanrija pseudolonga]|uniref:Cyanate hydratase n=1 Tax=Vanrija pseudolonga TaxID=143232 RepID=A0AAF1BN42_9TREE|nr:Cyanate hydratase [Vanrija pseudolonga]
MAALHAHSVTLLEAKQRSGLTFAQIAEKVGKEEVWVATVFFGNMYADDETAAKIAAAVGLSDEATIKAVAGKGPASLGVDGMVVRKPSWEGGVPTDPVLYRLYEVIMVHGLSIKAIIQEKFQDGIMSAINFKAKVDRVPDPKGDRVVITLDGKFLSYEF